MHDRCFIGKSQAKPWRTCRVPRRRLHLVLLLLPRSSRASIPLWLAAKRISQSHKEKSLSPSSRRFSIIAAWSGTAGQERWRIWGWREPTCCKRELRREQTQILPARARGAYKDFLTLWQDADPDMPILKQAKAEYAKLRSSTVVTALQKGA